MTQTDLTMNALSMWALIVAGSAFILCCIIIYGEWKR